MSFDKIFFFTKPFLFNHCLYFFGAGRKEEGYEHLKKALEHYTKWSQYEDGAELETGKKEMFGEGKIIKGKDCILMPDGTRTPISYADNFEASAPRVLFYAMTAPRGWEWFNSVRSEERFKEIVEKAQKLKDSIK